MFNFISLHDVLIKTIKRNHDASTTVAQKKKKGLKIPKVGQNIKQLELHTLSRRKCAFVCSLWTAVWPLPLKLRLCSLHDPLIPLLGVHPTETPSRTQQQPL